MKRFLTFLIIISLFNTNINSQIIFTDLNPDITISDLNQGYAFDINNDGKIDFHIVLHSNYGVNVMNLIKDEDEDHNYVINEGGDNGGAKIINYGESISSSSDWYEIDSGWGDILYGYWQSSGEFGYWTGTQEDKYLGIKFYIGYSLHYAWIHLTTHVYSTDNMDFTVKGFAYNSVPDAAISAGDEGSGIYVENIKNNSFYVYPNPANEFINIYGGIFGKWQYS